ncbi:MAG: hypothetical protein AB7N76_11385 [Planctomycetota bacterium]
MGIKQPPGAPFDQHLEPGESLAWADRPGFPRALRRLGIPPRSTAHILWVGLALTALGGLLLTGAAQPGLSPTARALCLAAGGLPLLGLSGWIAWAVRRRGRTRYGLTDRGRALLAEGSRVRSAPLPPDARPVAEADLAFGVLDLGAFRFEDLAYPAALDGVLAGIRATRQPPG